jgi:hypothetical protein
MSGSTTWLIVISPFGPHQTGDLISDAGIVAAILGSENRKKVQQLSVSGGTYTAGSGTGTTTGTTTVAGGSGGAGTALTAAQLAAIANEPVDATAIAAQATQIASLQSALAGGSGAAVTTGTLMAAGTSQATAAALPNTINVVTSTPSGAGVILPAGGQCVVENKDPANALLVYPPAGAAIGSGATNAPAQIVPGGTAVFSALNATQWFSE